MPILLAFLVSAAAVVGLSRLPAPVVKAAEFPIAGPKSVSVPPGIATGAYPPSLTLNGSTAYNNKFSPDPYADLHLPLAMVYDLHFVHRLGRIDLFNNGPGNSLRQVRLFTSEDGEAWLPAGSLNLKDIPVWESLRFPEVSARFVKLEIHSFWGSLPEFRQIAFYSSRAQGPRAEVKRPLLDGPAGDATLVRTIIPGQAASGVTARLWKGSNASYYYDPERITADVGPLPPGRYLASMLFDETQPLSRVMLYQGPNKEKETFSVPGPGRVYKTFPFEVAEGGRPRIPLDLTVVEGANAFLSGLWIYRRSEGTGGSGRSLALSAWPFAPAPAKPWSSNDELGRAADSLRQEGLTLFHGETHWGLDFLIPEGEWAGDQARFSSLSLYFHDAADRRATFGPETLHLRVGVRDRGDGKPVVDLVPHLGSAQTEAASNILDQPRYPGFQGRVQGRRLSLLWPRVSKGNEGAFLNLMVEDTDRRDAWMLVSRSTLPQDWASVRFYTFRETQLVVPPQMIPGLTYDLTVRDPLAHTNAVAVRLTEGGRSRDLILTEGRPGAHVWRGNFTPANRTANGDQLRFDYRGLTAFTTLQTGNDAVLMLLGPDGTGRDSAGWMEGDRVLLRVVDEDFGNPGTNFLPEVELEWDSGRLDRKEIVKLSPGARPSEREVTLTLPAVTNIDPQTGTYRLTVTYRDIFGGMGWKERSIHKSLSVRERVVRRPVRRDTWTTLGTVAGEEVRVRVGNRALGIEVKGGKYPSPQPPAMTGSEGWLFFVNEEPDRRDALDRWLYRRTYLLVPGGGWRPWAVTNLHLSFETNVRVEGRMETKARTLDQVLFIPELSTNGVVIPPGTPLDGISNLVFGGRWVTNVQTVLDPEWKERTNVTLKVLTNVEVKPMASVEDLFRTLGGPETGALRLSKPEADTWRLEGELVRPVSTGLLFNAMRFRVDGSQIFLTEPIQGDAFRGFFLESPAPE